MRTALRMAISLAAVVGLVPASLAQGSRGLDPGKSAGIRAATQQRQTQTPGINGSVSLAVPTGRVWVGHGSVDGEPVYVRRMTVREGMTIVEASTTPFMPVLNSSQGAPGGGQLIARPDQPASW